MFLFFLPSFYVILFLLLEGLICVSRTWGLQLELELSTSSLSCLWVSLFLQKFRHVTNSFNFEQPILMKDLTSSSSTWTTSACALEIFSFLPVLLYGRITNLVMADYIKLNLQLERYLILSCHHCLHCLKSSLHGLAILPSQLRQHFGQFMPSQLFRQVSFNCLPWHASPYLGPAC